MKLAGGVVFSFVSSRFCDGAITVCHTASRRCARAVRMQLGSCNTFSALVDSATMPRGVTVASAMSPDLRQSPFPRSNGAKSSSRFGEDIVSGFE